VSAFEAGQRVYIERGPYKGIRATVVDPPVSSTGHRVNELLCFVKFDAKHAVYGTGTGAVAVLAAWFRPLNALELISEV
jgi:hypothetical protein